MPADETSSQDEVIAFLSDPASYSPTPETVERIDTHGAMVFLAGERVYKIKRAVRLPYFDFSTLEKRRRACEREVEINRLTAPQIYLGVAPVRRDADGKPSFGGNGDVIEWAVEMVRFDQDALLDRMAGKGDLPLSLMTPLAEHIADYHASAPVHRAGGGTAALGDVVRMVADAISDAGDERGDTDMRDYAGALMRCFADAETQLAGREKKGYVRRCHGDLHLRNIVVLDGAPALFDAIEFDEQIATIDILYDLAFLLMDLWRQDMKSHANMVLNRTLWREGARDNIAALGQLPLFLSLRAGIRAMVTLDRLSQPEGGERNGLENEAMTYFHLAREFLAPPSPRLIAVGGLSGTGKSTLAAALAPSFGAAPGAFHIRSDVERKLMFGAAPEEKLDKEAYGQEATERVYATLNEKAVTALNAGQAVILDAVFARPEERGAAERMAQETGVPFEGLWLTAPEKELIRRVEAREGDASDADAAIVRRQSGCETGAIGWRELDAGGAPDDTLAAACRTLGIKPNGGEW